MKSIPLSILLFSVAFLAGCAKYQYFSVTSRQLPTQLDGSLKFEDDTVKVVYSFQQDGNIRIEVTNMLDDLIYVDLEKSAMVFNLESYPYSDGKTSFVGLSSTYEWTDNFETGSFSGTLTSSPNKKYIPPGARVSHEFKNVPFGYRDLKAMEAKGVILPNGTPAKIYSLNEDDSENVFLSYLYLGDGDSTEPHVLKHHFHISHIAETWRGNQHMTLNQFGRSKITAAGRVSLFAGLGGIVAVIAVVNANVEEQ